MTTWREEYKNMTADIERLLGERQRWLDEIEGLRQVIKEIELKALLAESRNDARAIARLAHTALSE